MAYWINYTTTVRIFVARPVCCAHCGQHYIYDMNAQGVGVGTAHGGQGRDLAQQRSSENARAQAEAKLADAIDCVPCPSCGAYQPDMVAVMKKNHRRWLAHAGYSALLLALGLFGLSLMAKKVHGPSVLTAAGALGGVGFSLLTLRAFLANRYDPNAGDPAERRLLGQARAYRPEDADKIQQDRDNQITAEKRTREGDEELKKAGGVLCLGLVALVVALGVGFNGVEHILNGQASPHWPTVKGEINRCDTVQRRGQRNQYETTELSYSYEVDGHKYLSRTLSFGPSPSPSDKALKQYQNGQSVTVHYKPENPSIAVLQPGLKSGSYTMAMVAGVALLVSLGCFLTYRSSYRTYKELQRKAANAQAKMWRMPVEVA